MKSCQALKPILQQTQHWSFRPVSISLSPNTEKDDILLALRLVFQPWRWKTGKIVQVLEKKFKKYLGVDYAFAFNSGRSSLMAILEAMEIKEGDEVLLQGFTCNAAINPILKLGAKPVFVDIDDTLNLDPEDLKRKITPRSKAVMIQHNFGWPAQFDEISKIAKENDLYLIEDSAHSLGAEYKGKLCGTFGDAAFFSFGRDKIISSVFGGMAVTKNRKLAERIKEFQKNIDKPSNFWILQQLLHPVLMNYLVLPAYGINSGLGRLFLGALHKLFILSKAVYKKEKRGEISEYFPKKMPNALAVLALNQFKKIERFNQYRKKIADFYTKELKNSGFILPLSGSQKDKKPIFMRYPILITDTAPVDTDRILKEARRKKIFLDDGWRKTPIVPSDTSIEKVGYSFGVCPRAEKTARNIINLPTHINISQNDAQKVVDFIISEFEKF